MDLNLERSGGGVPGCFNSGPVSDGRLVSVLVSRDVFVEVGQAAGCSLSDVAELVPRHHVGLQVVCQRALKRQQTNKNNNINTWLIFYLLGLC